MIKIEKISHSFKERKALSNISFSIERGEIFGLLGPNGSGKTTLFRILSTLFPPSSGNITLDSLDLIKDYAEVRKKIGVVFQSPSLDGKLTVLENLKHQGHLYGLSGKTLSQRCEVMLSRLGIQDRAKDTVEKLSGGLKRRVELAKGMIHNPEILILDEPSTGLDPGARIDLWQYLTNLKEKDKVTILVTTHLMEEAEHCDRLIILNHGKKVTIGSPNELKGQVGGDVLNLKTDDNQSIAKEIEERFKSKTILVDGQIQIEHPEGHRFVTDLVEAFPGRIETITFRKPTLEDVFVHNTGHQFWEDNQKGVN